MLRVVAPSTLTDRDVGPRWSHVSPVSPLLTGHFCQRNGRDSQFGELSVRSRLVSTHF